MNRTKNITLILFLLLLGTTSCFTTKKAVVPATSVFPLSDTVTLRNGTLIYALPRTILTVNVEMERTIEIPGPYAAYAGDLLGLDKVITSQGEMWTIKGVSVKSHEESDPSQYYVIRTNTVFKSNVLALKNEGLILDINPLRLSGEGSASIDKSFDTEKFQSSDLGSDEYYISQNDTAYRRVALDSTFIRIPYVVEKKKRLTTAQMAERAAKRLMELRDGKIMILTGEANVYPQDEAPIAEINKMIKDYTELFTGKKFTESRMYTCQLIPEKAQQSTPVSLLKFSEMTGPENISSKTGSVISIMLTPEKKTVRLSGVVNDSPVMSPTSGVFYRIPDIAEIRISVGNEEIHKTRKMIFQFGELMELPGNYLIGR